MAIAKLVLEEYKSQAQVSLYTVTSVTQVGKWLLETAIISTKMTNIVGDLPSPIPQNVQGGKMQFHSHVKGICSLFITFFIVPGGECLCDVLQTSWPMASKP